jgi:hypothetical protein
MLHLGDPMPKRYVTERALRGLGDPPGSGEKVQAPYGSGTPA